MIHAKFLENIVSSNRCAASAELTSSSKLRTGLPKLSIYVLTGVHEKVAISLLPPYSFTHTPE